MKISKKGKLNIKPKKPKELKEVERNLNKGNSYSKKLAKFQQKQAAQTQVKKRVKKISKWTAAGLLLFVLATIYISNKNFFDQYIRFGKEKISQNQTAQNEHLKYGFDFRNFEVKRDILATPQNVLDILNNWGIPQSTIDDLKLPIIEQNAYNELEQGKKVSLLSSLSNGQPLHFVYEHSPNNYMVLHLNENIGVQMVEKDLNIQIKEAACIVVENSIATTILNNGLRYELIFKMENALASKIDFFKEVKTGNRFKLIYEEKWVEQQMVGIGELLAIYFETADEQVYGYHYKDENGIQYLDHSARPMKTSFLLAPVKYARISSFYSKNRLHPVTKKVKPHLGTDYAAPEGTPIFAVADGVVIAAQFKEYNGNYVKLKHNDIYETQYLHMQRFGTGIKVGTPVKQGDVIGYVGSTGQSTGPHVCFRFWKNGNQVNHLKEELPQAEPLPIEQISSFIEHRDSLLFKLSSIRVYN